MMLRKTLCLCASLVLLAGCQQIAENTQSIGATVSYDLDDHQITAGVTITFKGDVPAAVEQQLVDAGAVKLKGGRSFQFGAVDTDARRNAVTAALVAGARTGPE